jgi:hypothetical protein
MGQTTFSGPVKSNNGFTETPITTTQRNAISSPSAGLLIFNSTTSTYQVYNGSAWVEAFDAGPPPGPTTYTLNTDYTYLSYISFQGNRIDIRGVTNEGLRSAILALQIGGTLVMTTGGNSYTMTITTVFTEVGGVPNSYVASADSSPSAINFADYNTITV